MEGSQIVNKQIWKPIHLSAIKGDEKLLLRILERGQLDRFFFPITHVDYFLGKQITKVVLLFIWTGHPVCMP